MSRYINTKADIVFWKVFGQHEHLVMSLLNALLPLEDGKQVEHVKCQDPAWPLRTQFSEDTLFEVVCEETGGRKFIVEMQMIWKAYNERRERFCEVMAAAGKLRKMKDVVLRQSVFVLSLVNDTLDPNNEEYYHYYHLSPGQDSCKEQDDLDLIFIELPKFKPGNLAEKKMQVLWLRFLTEIDEKTRRPPQELVDDPHVNEALEIVEESTFSRGAMLAYDQFWDRISREVTAENAMRRTTAALEEATAERDAATARADAALEKLHQTVRQMKASGMALEMIAKFTGLTIAEIDGI